MTNQVTIDIADRAGERHRVVTREGRSLMEVLRDEAGMDIAAACGGCCICATCHVYVAPEWIDRLPRAADEEAELVAQLEYAEHASRLACQIPVSLALDGLVLTLAPEE